MCHLDTSSTQKLLMKMGLILIVIGHLNFIASALVHRTVLHHIANPQDAISLQYAISKVISVDLAMLRWVVFSLSISSNCSVFCAVGLAISIIFTFVNNGCTLLALCTFADVDFIQIVHECAFDPTRVYSSTLCLWGLSFFLDFVEIFFNIRCFLILFQLLNLSCRRTCKKNVTLKIVTTES